jgi:C1A family cysteine protease
MKAVVVLLLGLVAVSALPRLDESEYRTQFAAWVKKNNKQYETGHIFAKFATFKENVELIRRHNAGNHSYTMGVNLFADMNREEFKAFVHSMPPKIPAATTMYKRPAHLVGAAPQEIDWRDKGVVTPVKNQGQCWSCWAFSTAGTLESWHAIKNGGPSALVSLSEQELVDCANDQCYGCSGGWPYKAMEFVEQNGLCSESGYPYEGQDQPCAMSQCTPVIKPGDLTGYTQMATEDDMTTALLDGPISVLVEADQAAFQFYQSGVMDDPSCGTQIDHAIINVGLSMSQGANGYWIVKNSWGASWGDNGYIMIARDVNECGISTTPTQPNY